MNTTAIATSGKTRRYLTDPEEIRAFRVKQIKRILYMARKESKKLPGKMVTLFNRAVAQFALTCAFLAACAGSMAVLIWAVTYILERCTVL